MTWGFTAQRRAEEFDALVEGTAPTGGAAQTRPLEQELLELVAALRSVPAVSARPEFVADLRGRLMAEAETALVPADLSKLRLPERRKSRERKVAALVASVAIVGAGTSMAVASQAALPGDTLYPVKRALEEAHTSLSVGEGSKGATMLANAADRLDEVEALSRQGGTADDARVPETLATFTQQATTASDLLLADYDHSGDNGSIRSLRDFASASIDQLATIEPLMPEEASDELEQATSILLQIDHEAAQRCPDCGGTPIDSIPPVLAAAEVITVPELPVTPDTPDTDAASPGKKQDGRGPGKADDGQLDVPDVAAGALPPGSVQQPEPGAAEPSGSSGGVSVTDPLPGIGPSASSDPIRSLTDGLTGGLTGGLVGGLTGGPDPSGKPTHAPSLPAVGDVVDGVDGLLHGIVDPLTGQTAKP